ncbi:MAG: ABC transporter substrate-binding protein [Burkholderiales bacterium]|nr:ABC transporter substrate-binding protein [Burkholderiales bacterium]
MKSRRNILFSLLATGLLAPLRPWAQPTARMPRVGLLTLASPKPQIPRPIAAFLQAIRELGYIDGQTIRIEFGWAEGKSERLTELADGLVRDKVDVIVATGDAPIRAALRATSTIPIVMATSGDAVGAGFVASLPRPGGNITGMTAIAPELSAKRLQIIKELLPRVSRVAVLLSPNDPVHAVEWSYMQAVEKTIGVKLRSVELRNAEDFDDAFAGLARAPADALVVLHNGLIRAQRERIVNFAAKSKMPAIYEAAEYADAGGLMAYGVTHADLFRRSASHVDKILKGAKPADIPVEQPTRLELVFNHRTATALDIAIPRSLLLRVDRVVE